MTHLLTLSAYLLDMLIITVFLDNLFSRDKRRGTVTYYVALVAAEFALFLNEYWIKTVNVPHAKALTMGISLFTTFLLCFFYESSLQWKFLAACIFSNSGVCRRNYLHLSGVCDLSGFSSSGRYEYSL